MKEFSTRLVAEKIVIVGAGFVGTQLAKTLAEEGRDVVLIDRDADKVREVSNQIDCAVVLSDGNSPAALVEAGIEKADALVAVTEQDEVNMITCSYVESHFPEVYRIARVRNYDYYKSALSSDSGRQVYGIDKAIHPNVVVAEAILAAIGNGIVGETIDLEDGYGIVHLTVEKDSALEGRALKDLPSLEDWNYLIASIERGAESILPNGESVLLAGDHIGVLAPRGEFPALMRFAGIEGVKARRLVIFGAGQIGQIIAARSDLKRVTIVDSDKERTKHIAEQVSKAKVVCGSLTEEDIIEEENLAENDLFVAVSENYDQNLVLASYMKTLGVAKTIALTSSSAVGVVARKLGIDVAVPMRDTVVDGIMGSLRGRGVTSVHTICAGAFEILTCKIGAKAKAAGKKLKDLALNNLALVLLVQSAEEEKMIMPKGVHVVLPGERIVFVAPKGDNRAIKLFGDR